LKYEIDLTPEDEAAVLAVMRPTGYRLLVAVAKIQEKQGSLYLPQQAKADEEVASILGKVIAMGGDAYSDRSRFPNGEYCKPGDVILMASYSGRRFKIKDREFRIINDDTVMAVVASPEEIERA